MLSEERNYIYLTWNCSKCGSWAHMSFQIMGCRSTKEITTDPFFPRFFIGWQGHLQKLALPYFHLQEPAAPHLSSIGMSSQPLPLLGRISPLTYPSPTCHLIPALVDRKRPCLIASAPGSVSFSGASPEHFDGTTFYLFIVHCSIYHRGYVLLSAETD